MGAGVTHNNGTNSVAEFILIDRIGGGNWSDEGDCTGKNEGTGRQPLLSAEQLVCWRGKKIKRPSRTPTGSGERNISGRTLCKIFQGS